MCNVARDKKNRLKIMAKIVKIVGIGFEKPSVNFKPIAKAISAKPAITSKTQDEDIITPF